MHIYQYHAEIVVSSLTFYHVLYRQAQSQVLSSFPLDSQVFPASPFHTQLMSMRVPFVAAQYGLAIGRYRSVPALQPERDYRVQQTTLAKGFGSEEQLEGVKFQLTLCPFSIKARSQTATSPANLLNSRT